jgi:aarF domain-containing kinase
MCMTVWVCVPWPPYTQVVLKVLKPGVEDTLTADMSFVYLMSRYLEFIQAGLGVT